MAQLLNIFSMMSIAWSLSGVLAVVLILTICLFKWRKQTVIFLKIIGCLVLFVALPVSAVFCGVQVNGYLSAEGGIFGQIKKSLGINTGKVTTDTFEVSGLNLRLDENKEYSATIRVDIEAAESTIQINPTKQYALLVNGALTSDNFMSTTGDAVALSADYTYQFNNFQKEEISKDTLHISFMLNKNDIVCKLSSNGGAVAQNLWKLYYQKNGMKIKFVESDYKKNTISGGNSEENPGENPGGEVTDKYLSLSFNNGDDVIYTKVIKSGSTLSDIPTAEKYGYKFVGWTEDETTIFDFSKEITEDKSFSPVFEKDTQWKSYEFSDPKCIQPDALKANNEYLTQEEVFLLNKDKKIFDVKVKIYEIDLSLKTDNFPNTSASTHYTIDQNLNLVQGTTHCNTWISLGETIEFEWNGVKQVISFERNSDDSFIFKLTNQNFFNSYVARLYISEYQFEVGK